MESGFHGSPPPPGGVGRRVRGYACGLVVAAFCWVGMMWAHELGHVIGGTLSGGHVEGVVLAPWAFSRTDMDTDPHPLVTAWAGAIGGCLLPLAGWRAWRRGVLARVFAAFCLLANGAYLFFGSFEPVADAAVLRRLGAPHGVLLAAGAIAMAGAAVVIGPLVAQGVRGRGARLSAREVVLAAALLVAMAAIGGLFFGDSS